MALTIDQIDARAEALEAEAARLEAEAAEESCYRRSNMLEWAAEKREKAAAWRRAEAPADLAICAAEVDDSSAIAVLDVYRDQCAAVAAEALAARYDEWCKWPAHYKKCKRAAVRIVAEALPGEKINAYMTIDGRTVKIRFYYDMETPGCYTSPREVWAYTDNNGYIPRNEIESMARAACSEAVRSMTAADVLEVVASHDSRVKELEELKKEYRARARSIVGPLEMIGMRDFRAEIDYI